MPKPESSLTQRAPSRIRWRSLFRFQLRTLLVVMVLVAVCLAWWSNRWSHRARQQREAVAALKPFARSVVYDEPSHWPAWLVDSLGEDYFASVIGLELSSASDPLLAHVAQLKKLERLSIASIPIRDRGLAHIKNLTAMKELNLYKTHITDSGLEYLKDLTALERLDLGMTLVTDAGLEHLRTLTALEVVDLRGSYVTGDGADRLQRALPKCRNVLPGYGNRQRDATGSSPTPPPTLAP